MFFVFACLQAYEKWLDGQGEVSPISNEGRKLLDQCRVKNKMILSHESRANKLKEKAQETLRSHVKANEDEDLKQEIEMFQTKWDEVVKRFVYKFTLPVEFSFQCL